MQNIEKEIQSHLFELQDKEYAKFHAKLVPNVNPNIVIGIRNPVLRKYAKELSNNPEAKEFMRILPHKYDDENNLHSFLIENMKDFDECIEAIDLFLPYVDNWATCDSMSPKVLKKHLPELLQKIKQWIKSDATYTIRFGIEMLMSFYLDDAFKPEYLELVAVVKSEEYYVNMMIAWFFATALAKQYDSVLPIIESKRLDKWVHNKTIQKAVESYRITDEQKIYLKSLKIK